ncbi:MAG: uracil-DNA glycosylase [Clostridiales bacterium]|nr:uracil-DNA glycosylase [Clostridiales bacterium]
MKPIARFRQVCTAFFDSLSPSEEKPLVFGDGLSQKPVLMLIGEAPGEQETLLGKPFVGKAGKNLNEFLEVLNLKRSDIYISNVVKVRPTKISAAGRVVNRPPTREEKALFTPWLMREIEIVRPGAIVTLGNVALQAFIKETIGNMHGQWHRAVISSPKEAAFTLPLFALYHPASIIYRAALKETYYDDLNTLAQSLNVQSINVTDI